MSSGRRSRSTGSRLRPVAPLGALVLVASVVIGGCAGGGSVPGQATERQGALERWTRCIEREGEAGALPAVRTRLARRCEGHRRDVLRAFPPNMEPRLERLMDERTEVMLRTRLREDGRSLKEEDPRLRRVLDALSGS